MLIKGSSDFKTLVPAVSRNLSWDTLGGYARLAEEKYLVPYLSRELIAQLDDAYDPTVEGQGLQGDQVELVRLLRAALAFYTLLEGLPYMTLTIGDLGVLQETGPNLQPADRFAVQDARRAAANTADGYMESALAFLSSHADSFSTWKSSLAYQLMKGLLLSSATDYAKTVQVQQPWRVFQQMRPYLLDAEESHLVQILGDALYDELKEAWQSDQLTVEQEALRQACHPVLALAATIAGVTSLQVKIDEYGPRVSSFQLGYKSEAPGTIDQLSRYLEMQRQRLELATAKLTRWLKANAQSYPTYKPADGQGSDAALDLPKNDPNSSCFSIN